MLGKIVKGIGGFYYVAAADGKIYETRARGLFRKEGIRPSVGDDCEIEIPDAESLSGSVVSILPRRSILYRPVVANADQAIVIFAVSKPEPHFGLIDRYLTGMLWQEMPVILVLNKIDQDPEKGEEMADQYRRAGFTVLLTSAKKKEGIGELRASMEGKTSVLSGPSGVGKTSLLNALFPEKRMETGEISERIGRGKHTTRHSELMVVGKNTYICDTPGFSSVELPEDMDEDTLCYGFPEFTPFLGKCRFTSCRHMAEPDCVVKQAVEDGEIEKSRYASYCSMLEELKGRRRY